MRSCQRLRREEREISRERIIHGKLDIIRAEIVRRLRDKQKRATGCFERRASTL